MAETAGVEPTALENNPVEEVKKTGAEAVEESEGKGNSAGELIQNTLDDVKEKTKKLEEMKKNIENEASKKEEQRSDCDARSIYVKNVDYKTEATELKEHFASCGAVTRITLFRDQVTGHPLGYAYIEFADAEAVEKAIKLNDSLFKGRQIIVEKKRKNTPGLRRRRYGYFPGPRMSRGFPPYGRRSRYMFY